MAKKLTGLFVAFLLLLSGSGFALTIHFCQGEIAGARWASMSGAGSDEGCCGSDAGKMKDCCADKVVKPEKQSDSVLKYFSVDFPVAVLADEFRVALHSDYFHAPLSQLFASSCRANAPPLYLLHQQWLLYA